MLRRQVRYVGRVQGVGFRASTSHLAASFAVSGWVRNEPDGSVLLEAQGTPDEVDRFLAAVANRLARYIQSASTAHAATVPAESGFAIQR
ncbi:MAG: acylphosphatase [Phycisphaerales bacterium]